jgi:hypothetical protein
MPIRSIAVLPLENLAGDRGQQYFADGMTDALITDLAQIGSRRVISRTSTMHYRDSRKSLPEIAKELGVGRRWRIARSRPNSLGFQDRRGARLFFLKALSRARMYGVMPRAAI